MSKLLNFPEKLRNLNQWVLWKKEKKADGKWTKVPYQPNGRRAATNRPEEWSSFDECFDAYLLKENGFTGLGFVFDVGVVGIDLDHCIENGVIADWARDVLNMFPSYTELSPSGEGLHILLESDLTFEGRKRKMIECYSSGRFFTVTGDVFEERNKLIDCDIKEWFTSTFGVNETKQDEVEVDTDVELPGDDKIKTVLFGSKNGAKMKALYYGGDWASQGYDSQSNADLALVGSLMYFCCNNRKRVDSLFRSSSLFRSKWNDKHGAKTYGEMTMDKAAVKLPMEWKILTGFIMSGGKNNVPLIIIENIRRAAISIQSLRDKFRLNDFSHMIEVNRGGSWDNMQDIDILDATLIISMQYECFARVGKEMVADALRLLAYSNRVNPQLNYFMGLVWDGKSRLDGWLHTAFGTPLDALHASMGSNWIKGLVKRVIEPGCVFDEVLVLEGKQGMRKSTAMRVLGKPWHTECTLSTEDKDFYMLLARSVIVEFSEGEIVGRTSAQRLKAVITKTEDTFRPPYEHGMMTFKRSCVFAMTTNNGDYQKDDTGGRRWLPVVLQKEADIDWLTANRDQLFAEAIYRIKEFGETSYEYPWEELSKLQEEKTEEDVYDEPIQNWYNNIIPDHRRLQGIRVDEVYEEVVMKDIDIRSAMDKRMEWRLGSILRRALKLERRLVRYNGNVVRRWVK